MSLRDQLLKAGLTDKKKVAKTNRKLKKNRRNDQAQRDSKAEVRRKEERAAKAAAKQRQREATAERNRLLAIQEAQAKQRMLRKVIRSYAVPQREGPVSFWHRAPNGTTLLRLRIPESWALDLRSGRMAVAWTGPNTTIFEVVILPQHAALRVAATDPSRLLFFNAAPPHWRRPRRATVWNPRRDECAEHSCAPARAHLQPSAHSPVRHGATGPSR